MTSTQNSTPNAPPGIPLPPDFLTIEQIQNLSSAAIRAGQKINVVGFVKDFQPPIPSRGTDYKCTLEIVDSSVPYGSHGMKVNIFWPSENMPRVDGAGDVALIRNIKVQMFGGGVSLLANFATGILILPASKIPTNLSTSANAPWRCYPPRKAKKPTLSEISYMIGTSSCVQELNLPSVGDFYERSNQAMNVKDKFALLKDVKPGGFYDLLGEVVQVYDGSSEGLTVHLSDYTANSEFYNHAWGGGEILKGRDGDEHGYIKSRPKTNKDWSGPYGKMSIQLTLYDGHAAFVREEVKVEQWVLLRNVNIKYGNQGGRLEGFLRGDRNAFEGKVQVEVMKQSDGPDENDPRWVEAVKRKRKWGEKFKQEKNDFEDEVAGKKRKREGEPVKDNSKSRRKAMRAAADRKVAATEMKVKTKLDLNENSCAHPDQPTVLLSDILRPRNVFNQKDGGQAYTSPFDVCNYKADVRVVDFFPPKIEDFAVGRRPSEFDMLSDYSGGEDTDPQEDMRMYRAGKGFPGKTWEWRFALQVVNASNKASTERIWLIVGNYDAQMLLNVEATNLRKDTDTLGEVKERLCLLWGDLEEQKSALTRAKQPKTHIASSMEPRSSPPPSRRPGDQPPTDSDDEGENKERKGKKMKSRSTALNEQDPNIMAKNPGMALKSSTELQIKNKAFTCCIKQYGAKVNEEDPSLANAGNGKRWERRFGLFDTHIK